MARIRTAAVAVAAMAAASCSAFTVLPTTNVGPASASSLFDTASAVELPVGSISTASKTPFTDSQPSPSRQQPKQQQQKKKSGSKAGNSNDKRRSNNSNNKSGSKKVNSSATTLPKRNRNRKNGSKNSSKGGNAKKRRPRPTLQPLSALKLGSKIDGVVAGISLFGAFIKTRYAIRPQDDTKQRKEAGYALLHKSQISDEKIDDISQVLRVGDQIKNARVVSINYAKGEVAISLRKPRPKRRSLDDIRVGGEYDGKIANVTPYGAFVDIGAKKNALLHISRITQEKVSNIRDYVNENDWVTVHIINKDNGALACSMLDKQADEYLNKRQRQKQRKADNRKEAEDATADDSLDSLDKSELAAFEEAIRDLENAFNSKK